jgi:ribosomal protein L5
MALCNEDGGFLFFVRYKPNVYIIGMNITLTLFSSDKRDKVRRTYVNRTNMSQYAMQLVPVPLKGL